MEKISNIFRIGIEKEDVELDIRFSKDSAYTARSLIEEIMEMLLDKESEIDEILESYYVNHYCFSGNPRVIDGYYDRDEKLRSIELDNGVSIKGDFEVYLYDEPFTFEE